MPKSYVIIAQKWREKKLNDKKRKKNERITVGARQKIGICTWRLCTRTGYCLFLPPFTLKNNSVCVRCIFVAFFANSSGEKKIVKKIFGVQF